MCMQTCMYCIMQERLRHLEAGIEKGSGWVSRRLLTQICHSADTEALTALKFGYSQRLLWIICHFSAYSSSHKEFVQRPATRPESLLMESWRAKCFHFSPCSFSWWFLSEICWRYYKIELLNYKFLPDKLFCKQYNSLHRRDFCYPRQSPDLKCSWTNNPQIYIHLFFPC